MSDPVLQRVAREDPGAAGPADPVTRAAMLARLRASVDPPEPRRAPRRGPVAAALGVTIVATIVVAVTFMLLDHHRSEPVPAVHNPPRPVQPVTPAGSILRRSGATALLISHGSLWVAATKYVARVDPRSGAVLHRIPIRSSGVGPGQLAAGAGSIWAAYQGTPWILRIDPSTDRVIARISHGREADGGGAAFIDGRLWTSRDGTGPRSDVVAIDPRTDRTDGAPVTVGTGPGEIATGFGALWVDNTSDPHANLSRIDPRTRRMSYLSFGGTPFVGFGSVWAIPFLNPARVRRYDPRTDAVTALDVPRAAAIAFGDDRVWVGSAPKSSSSKVFDAVSGTARLTEVDPRTNRIVPRPISLPGDTTPNAMVVSGENLWIADYTAGLLHFRINR